jgi:hypothetical protein
LVLRKRDSSLWSQKEEEEEARRRKRNENEEEESGRQWSLVFIVEFFFFSSVVRRRGPTLLSTPTLLRQRAVFVFQCYKSPLHLYLFSRASRALSPNPPTAAKVRGTRSFIK